MLNAILTKNAVAMNIGCFTRAIRHLRQRFQATGSTEDRPRSGRPRVTTRDQDQYIRNTKLHNCFKTATATTVNTHGTQKKETSISVQSVIGIQACPRFYQNKHSDQFTSQLSNKCGF